MLNTADWKRISIEAFVIVGSILLAFAIDAAWESRQERQTESDLFRAIHADMQSNLDHLELVIDYHAESIEASRTIVTSTPGELAVRPTDDSRTGLNAVFMRQTYTPATGSLRNSDLSIIRDAELRKALGAWIGLSEELAEETASTEAAMTTLRSIAAPYGATLARNIFLGLIPPDNPLGSPTVNEMFARLRSDVDFMLTLLLVNVRRSGSMGEAERLMDATAEILRLFERDGILQ